jgi:hypothetical protein
LLKFNILGEKEGIEKVNEAANKLISAKNSAGIIDN